MQYNLYDRSLYLLYVTPNRLIKVILAILLTKMFQFLVKRASATELENSSYTGSKLLSLQNSGWPKPKLASFAFALVFLFRYTRVALTVLGHSRYRPTAISKFPTYKASDVTVVIPTTDMMPETFHTVVRSILKHSISKLIITTAGSKARVQEAEFPSLFSDPRIMFLHCDEKGRRKQTAHAMPYVHAPLLILQDDHTYWPPKKSWLKSVLTPFDAPNTGAVGVGLEARHRQHPFSFAGFMNFLGMTYLDRRRYEYCGTYGIDRGISTLSGRFGAFRTKIYADENFLEAYLNERVWHNSGPLDADDDKFHTRWLIEHGWDIALQAGPEATMTTELGEWPRYKGQVIRWLRTSCRSNPSSLSHKISWVRHPYTTFTLFAWFFRLSLIQEPLMFWLLRATLKAHDMLPVFRKTAITLYAFVTIMKFIKISAHLQKYPSDFVYFPSYILFGYYCTLVKIWAFFTWCNISWTTANVAKAPAEAAVVQEHQSLDEIPNNTYAESAQGITSRVRMQLGPLRSKTLYV
jgi:hypothetical protein